MTERSRNQWTRSFLESTSQRGCRMWPCVFSFSTLFPYLLSCASERVVFHGDMSPSWHGPVSGHYTCDRTAVRAARCSPSGAPATEGPPTWAPGWRSHTNPVLLGRSRRVSVLRRHAEPRLRGALVRGRRTGRRSDTSFTRPPRTLPVGGRRILDDGMAGNGGVLTGSPCQGTSGLDCLLRMSQCTSLSQLRLEFQ